jgi:hypothetical protein
MHGCAILRYYCSKLLFLVFHLMFNGQQHPCSYNYRLFCFLLSGCITTVTCINLDLTHSLTVYLRRQHQHPKNQHRTYPIASIGSRFSNTPFTISSQYFPQSPCFDRLHPDSPTPVLLHRPPDASFLRAAGVPLRLTRVPWRLMRITP